MEKKGREMSPENPLGFQGSVREKAGFSGHCPLGVQKREKMQEERTGNEAMHHMWKRRR
jgi:hypothetical protein